MEIFPLTNFLVCSGLSHESHRRDVEQIYLRCSQGSLEWLYPTGAVIVNLRPNVPPAHAAGLRACIRPLANSQVKWSKFSEDTESVGNVTSVCRLSDVTA